MSISGHLNYGQQLCGAVAGHLALWFNQVTSGDEFLLAGRLSSEPVAPSMGCWYICDCRGTDMCDILWAPQRG
jgi:hypothetical protein